MGIAAFFTAKANSSSPPVPPPAPAPNVAAALAEITQTLTWMASSKKTGGLGYSVAQVKETHAYAAAVALGGVWPA